MSTSSKSKTADFARLFERLSSYRSNISCGTPIQNDVQATSDSSDLAPVIKSLAPLVATRAYTYELKSSQHGSSDADSVAGVEDTSSDSSDDASLSEFPLEKRYPFTFSRMVHTLYGLEEWAEMVQDVVEKSRERYRPLAELGFEPKTHASEAQMEGRGHHKAEVAVEGANVQTQVDDAVRRDKGVALETSERKEMDIRDRDVILKKRCIGRRKWTDESMANEGTWIYDAAASSVEAARPSSLTPTAVHVPRDPIRKNNLSSVLHTARPAAGNVLEESFSGKLDARLGFHDAKDVGKRGGTGLGKSLTLGEAQCSRKRPFAL